jgi:heme exporter protein D
MALGPHAAFIVAAYLITAAVVLGLIVWVIADRRAQLRALAELDARGVRRRSEPTQARTA